MGKAEGSIVDTGVLNSIIAENDRDLRRCILAAQLQAQTAKHVCFFL
jgi:hypothetical protein